ncbi:MAG: hypothetical protein KGM44_09290, partial [bacterium]|nr:hypothetical protein [bacterium]
MLVIDSGIRVPSDGGSGWVRCFLRSWRSASGTRYVGIRLLNATPHAIVCVPAVGRGAALESVAPFQLSCEPKGGQSLTFPIARGMRVDRACVFVQGPGLRCCYQIPISAEGWDAGGSLQVVALGLAVGLLGFAAWDRLRSRSPAADRDEVSPQRVDAPTREHSEQREERRDEEHDALKATDAVQEPVAERPSRETLEVAIPEPAAVPAEALEPEVVSAPEVVSEAVPKAAHEPVQRSGEIAAQRVDPLDTPSMPIRRADAIVERPGSSVAIGGEGAAVIGSIELLERRVRSAEYELKVVNDSLEPLLCVAMAGRGGRLAGVDPVSFRIEAEAASAILLRVPLRLWAPFEHVLVQMRSRSLSYSVEAAVPRSPLLLPSVAVLALLVLFA